MTLTQTLLTILLLMLGTMLTRFLPFLLFPPGRETPHFVRYLGRVLPSAVLGMLLVYCYKDISLTQGNHGLPELLAGAIVLGIHLWRKNMFLSLAAGTGGYMLLLHFFA